MSTDHILHRCLLMSKYAYISGYRSISWRDWHSHPQMQSEGKGGWGQVGPRSDVWALFFAYEPLFIHFHLSERLWRDTKVHSGVRHCLKSVCGLIPAVGRISWCVSAMAMGHIRFQVKSKRRHEVLSWTIRLSNRHHTSMALDGIWTNVLAQ